MQDKQASPNKTDGKWTILELLKWTTSFFKSHNIDSPRVTGEIFLAHTLNLSRIDLYLQYDQPLHAHELSQYKKLILRRINHEPVAYILGEKEFWAMNLNVTPHVLIPRPDTECLVEKALTLLPKSPVAAPKRVLELGTGSGAVILAIASKRPGHLYFASDCSPKAVKVAKKNAIAHNLSDSIHFFVGKWFDALKKGIELFDIILSNPPYIPTPLIDKLQQEISNHEPRLALDGGADGLSCLSHILEHSFSYFKKGGHLLLEIGHDQKETIGKAIKSLNCYENVTFTKDYGGHDRVVQIDRKG